MDQQAYVDEICGRFQSRQHVRFDSDRAEENGSQVGHCHANVDAWVEAHPGDRAVRGWVIWHPTVDGFKLTAHSVVQDAAGSIFDITPLGDERGREGLGFVPHIGDDTAFFEIKAEMSSFDCRADRPG